MEMVAERLIKAPRHEVWRCLNDPEVLKACIPGCESIDATGPDGYKVAMVAAVGFIKARFVGDLTLQNKIDNTSYDLSFNGTGGAAGFGKGAASVSLSDAPDGTTLSYQVKAQVGGKLAQVGARVIDGVAKKMADEFFQRLDKAITGPGARGTDAAPDATASAGTTAPRAAGAAPAASSSRTWIYAAAAVVIAVAVAYAFGGGGA
ncbi:carbon monoxide dehydrogenase subunit G [Pigmentiphaga sp.]|uniref:CoxG family protein n=1 Tax=Pigmentiphaga sp. TaxID=1977564 RepID=UPI0025FC0577|nr:carbon monoxide dehydrogenase subunit G [Pigmentiphaga sp.]